MNMIPEEYEKLAVIGIAYKGGYAAETIYKRLNAVYHEGATYVALKDEPVGPPAADNINWQYMAKGFTEGVLSAVNAIDTSGVVGEAGETVGAQALIDAVADKVMNQLLRKSDLISQIVNDPEKAASAAAVYGVNEAVTQLNGDLTRVDTSLQGVVGTVTTLVANAPWKELGTVQGTQKISLPDNYKELCICVRNPYYTGSQIMPKGMPKNEIIISLTYSNEANYVRLQFEGNQVGIFAAYLDGQNKTNEAYLQVFYR